MSNLIVITAEMHKVAEFSINVKYRRPGNVVEYVPVEFEIFRDKEYFKAIPVETEESKRLTDLPKQVLFQIKNGIAGSFTKNGKEEVVEDIVNKLVELNLVEISKQKPIEKLDSGSYWISEYTKPTNYKKPIFFTISEQKFIDQCRSKYLELNKLNEIKDFFDYERQFEKVIKALSQKISETISSDFSAGRLKSSIVV